MSSAMKQAKMKALSELIKQMQKEESGGDDEGEERGLLQDSPESEQADRDLGGLDEIASREDEDEADEGEAIPMTPEEMEEKRSFMSKPVTKSSPMGGKTKAMMLSLKIEPKKMAMMKKAKKG